MLVEEVEKALLRDDEHLAKSLADTAPFQVDDSPGRFVDDLPAGGSQTHAPLQILKAHEDPVIEATHLLDGGAASATVAAVEASTLLRLDEPTLLALRRDQPDVALALLRALSQELVDRIRASSKALRGALGDDAPESSWWGSVLGGLFGGDRS